MNAASLLWLAGTQLWQLSLVILLVAVTARTCLRRRPHWAYILWVLALVKCLTPPLWSSPTGVFTWATSYRASEESASPSGAPLASDLAMASSSSPETPNPAQRSAATAETGTPIAGTSSAIDTPPSGNGFSWTTRYVWGTNEDRSGRAARTDAQGSFRIAPVNPGRFLAYAADHNEAEARDRFNDDRGAPLPAAFVPLRFEVPAAGVAQPVEIRAVPHVTIQAQYVDSAGTPCRGHDITLQGCRLAAGAKPPQDEPQGNIPLARADDPIDATYFAIGRIDQQGKVDLKVPRGISSAHLQASTNELGVLRIRRGKDGPLSNSTDVDLGTLDQDVKDIYIVRYKAPVLVVAATGPDGAKIDNFKPRVNYPAGTLPPRPKGSRWVSGVDGDVFLTPQHDGRWRSESLLPEQDFAIIVEAAGHKSVSQKLKLAEGEVREISVPLERDGK